MVRLIFIFALALFVTFSVMWTNVRAEPTVPELDQLISPPSIIKYQRKPHAVFNYGGLYFLFVVTQTPTPFPQCNAIQYLENELMVIGSNPFGYAFFTNPEPIAFKTDHSLLWNKLIEKSCEGCE